MRRQALEVKLGVVQAAAELHMEMSVLANSCYRLLDVPRQWECNGARFVLEIAAKGSTREAKEQCSTVRKEATT